MEQFLSYLISKIAEYYLAFAIMATFTFVIIWNAVSKFLKRWKRK